MINTQRLIKASVLWMTIMYVICFVAAALFPSIRSGFMLYGLHADIEVGRDVITFGTFVSGLIIWNIITYLSVWLFAILYNSTKK